MPAYCTHYVFACEMLPYLRQHANFKLNKDAVMLGTQGPDIFFFHRAAPWMIGKSLRKIGSMLHRSKPGDILDAFANYISKNSKKSDIATSYAYGFILHYTLDKNCHPFVYYKQNEILSNGSKMHKSSVHNIIEMSMDTVILNKITGVEKPQCFNTAITVPDDEIVLVEISRMMHFTIKNVLKINVDEKKIFQALKDTKTMQKLLHDETGKKTKAVAFLENLASPLTSNYKITSMLRPGDLEKSEKYGNIKGEVWHSPFEDGTRNESFFDLYQLSKADSKEIIDGFDNIINGRLSGKQVTNNKSFLTGVEVK